MVCFASSNFDADYIGIKHGWVMVVLIMYVPVTCGISFLLYDLPSFIHSSFIFLNLPFKDVRLGISQQH